MSTEASSGGVIGRYVGLGALAAAAGAACAIGTAWSGALGAVCAAGAAYLVAREFTSAAHAPGRSTDRPAASTESAGVGGSPPPQQPFTPESYVIKPVAWISLPVPGQTEGQQLPAGWEVPPVSAAYSVAESCGSCGATVRSRPDGTCERCGSTIGRLPSSLVSPTGDWVPYPPER